MRIEVEVRVQKLKDGKAADNYKVTREMLRAVGVV